MKLNSKENALVAKMISYWEDSAAIDEVTAKKLRSTLDEKQSNYQTLSFYAFLGAISCALLGFAALVLDEKWIERMRTYFEFSAFTIALLFFGLAVGIVFYLRKSKRIVHSHWAKESLSILCGLSVCVATVYLGKGFGGGDQYYWLLLIAGVLLAVAGFFVRSRLLWISSIIACSGWWMTYTDSFGGDYFWGMNIPMRALLWSGFVLAFHQIVKRFSKLEVFERVTYFSAWLLFLAAAWGVSIFGNYSWNEWFQYRQSRLIFWAVGLSLVLVVLLMYAIKKKDNALRDMVLIALVVNIYTRYFEYFWDITNKGLFFVILALSLWLVGRKLEQVRQKSVDEGPR